MASDIFTHVPNHVTLLFLFVCSCQMFLVLHITSLHAPAQVPDGAHDEHPPAHPLQHPGHGKLRLLWSVNSSNEAWEPNIPEAPHQPHTQDTLASSSQVLSHYKENLDRAGSGNFSDYTFTHIINQPFLCQRAEDEEEEAMETVFLLVVVHSHPSHKPQRDAIRATWGKQDYSVPVRLVFILGQSDSVPLLTRVRHEALLYRDIVLGNFTDTYRNLTVKALFGLQWAQTYCPSMQYMLKTDDDTYFNTTTLLHYLKSLPINKPLILGSLNSEAAVARRGLWQVNREQFSAPTFPTYCSGCAYVLSHSVIAPLLKAAHKVALLPIEDVYITGILAELAGTRCEPVRTFPYWTMGPSPRNLCSLLDNQLYGVHSVNYEKMYFIHNKVRIGHTCARNAISGKQV